MKARVKLVFNIWETHSKTNEDEKFHAVPEGLPWFVQELILSGNKITQLKITKSFLSASNSLGQVWFRIRLGFG